MGAVVVPDGSMNPFRLTAANMIDAREHGAKIFTYCEVKELIQEGGRIIGTKVYDNKNKIYRSFCTYSN